MKKYIISLMVIAYIIFATINYSQTQTVDGNQNLKVVASFYPMYMHTKAISEGSDIEVTNMTKNMAGCLHDYQISVSEMKLLQTADVFVINGLGAENFVEKAYLQNEELIVINASEALEGNEEVEACAHDHSDYEHDHLDHADGTNEHVWMETEGAILQIETIANALSEIDPNNRHIYQENKENYINKIREVQQEFLAHEHFKGQKVVLVHNSFEYLAEELGLEVVEIIVADEHQMPTPREVEAVINRMIEQEVSVILSEKQYSTLNIVNRIAEQTNSEVYELNAMVTPISVEEGEYEYVKGSYANIEKLKEAFK